MDIEPISIFLIYVLLQQRKNLLANCYPLRAVGSELGEKDQSVRTAIDPYRYMVNCGHCYLYSAK
jgi:hypothetical protein